MNVGTGVVNADFVKWSGLIKLSVYWIQLIGSDIRTCVVKWSKFEQRVPIVIIDLNYYVYVRGGRRIFPWGAINENAAF